MKEGSKAYGPTSHLRVSFTRICYSCPEEIYAFEADTPPIESGGETDPIDSLLLCQKAVNEISNAGPPTSKSVFWRRRDSRKSILSSENPTDVVSQPATHKLPYLKCISGRYGTDSQQKKKIAESKVGRIHFIGKERVVVDQAQPTRKRGSPKQGPFLRPSGSPWSCAAFDVQNRNEQDRGMPAV